MLTRAPDARKVPQLLSSWRAIVHLSPLLVSALFALLLLIFLERLLAKFVVLATLMVLVVQVGLAALAMLLLLSPMVLLLRVLFLVLLLVF